MLKEPLINTLNMDMSQRAVVNTLASEWIASPRAGVWRKLLFP